MPVSVVMVGIGGYGSHYLKTLLEEFSPGSIDLRGAVDPFPERSGIEQELKRQKIPVFPALEDFFGGGYSAELAVICSPLHFHVPQSCTALRHGCYVLCDKPIGAVVQEADELIRARDAAGRWVMIGYQWSYSAAIQSLKQDIMQGRFGKPLRLKTLCYWPRDMGYYRRNNWAGKKKDETGRWILDSPANNAMAHFLHNLFYVLGSEVHLSARPKEVTAELYRAYPIENFDTAACRAITQDGAELLFYGSHAVREERGPIFNFEFEEAVVSYGESSDEIVATDGENRVTSYGSPEADHHFRKLFEAVEAVTTAGPIVCGPEAAYAQTLCVNGLQESVPDIPSVPQAMVEGSGEGGRLWIKGLDEAFYQSYEQGVLPSEAGISWASAGRTVDLSDYRFFPA